MEKAIVSLCRALGELLYYASFDQEASELLAALATYVEKHGA